MKKNSFEEGTLIATVAIVLVKILGMLYVIPFYSIVGSDGGALYSYAYNIYLLFLGISSAGLPNAISKIISEYNALGYNNAKNRAYNIAKKIIGMVSTIAFIILFIFADEIGRFIIGNLQGGNTYQDVAFVIRCVAPSILVVPYLSITKGFLQGHKVIGPSSNSQLIEQIVRIFIILCGSYLCLKVFNGTLSLAIGIAVSGALFGGIAAYIYLRRNIKKLNKEIESKEETKEEEKQITNKEITRKIIRYAMPFIIISVVTNIYNFTDQILVLRTLEYLNFPGPEVEFVASAISTWSPKICMVLNAMAMGMTMSLIPTIVSAFAKKDKEEVNAKINKAVSMITFISLPLMFGIIAIATPVWTVFFNTNPAGPKILQLAIMSAYCANVYMITSTICQGLNKYKTVYFMSIAGFVSNALLDVPLMLLCRHIGLDAYLGSLISSIIGFTLSYFIGLRSLHIYENVNYKELKNNALKSFIPAILMFVTLLIIDAFLPFDRLDRIGAIITIVINGVIGGLIYIGISIKLGLIRNILGDEMVNKLLRKISLGKLGKEKK